MEHTFPNVALFT